MEKQEYQKHFELEQDFWWFAGKRLVVLSILKFRKILDGNTHTLDVGCGTGYNLKVFQEYGSAAGCDISLEALNYSKQRGLQKITQANAEELPFKDNSFDLITLLDVLYHKNVQSDVNALKETRRVLKQDGFLLITDSAFNFLRSRHDLAFHTRERYTRKSLCRRLEQADFKAVKICYYNFFLFFLIAFIRLLGKRPLKKKNKVESDLKQVHPVINAVLLSVLKLEARLIKRVNFPFGSSILCLVKKT